MTEAPRLTESASAVFAVLAQAGSATRPQLASLAGLSKPTVSAAVAELESARLATHSGTASSGTGRSAAVYGLGPASGSVLDTLLLDKTGTITLGNRQAAEFLP
ncbi:MarR family transcriptional regulator, partial [Streptomyces sp. NPDC007095]|uniref:MarR family transcriptional regulator n=1 Tax=Streptomyces sp. NPDC007095 TaxID=3154482 RepID=UPI0033C3D502